MTMRSPKILKLVLALVLLAPQALVAQYAISTLAGGGPNNLTALNSSIGYPGSIAFDSSGNTYIADSFSSRVFEIDSSGNLAVVAGNGTSGYSGDGGPATRATLNKPESVFVDGSGNIFIADTDNCLIREVSGGTITTVAGNAAIPNPCGYSGDGGPATSAQLYDPYGVFVDGSGNIFIADTDNCLIREVSGGIITTVAGSAGVSCGYSGDNGPATSATLDEPQGVFVASGNIFVADTDNNLIRVVNTGAAAVVVNGVSIPAGYIETVAGTYYVSEDGASCGYLTGNSGYGGPALSAELCLPGGVFVDGSGNLFIADTDDFVIGEVPASSVVASVNISATVGTVGSSGYSPNGTAANSALLNYPSGVNVDGSGDIFIADTDNFVIREVAAASSPVIQTTIGNNTLAYSGDGDPALDAELYTPGSVATDSAGNIYIADTSNSLIRVVNTGTTAISIAGVTIQPGDIQTVAGSYYVSALLNPCEYTGDGGAATSAQLCNPGGVFVDSSGNIYIADTQNNVIRAVNPNAPGGAAITVATVNIAAGDIATVAGNGMLCNPDTPTTCGDGGAAINAELNTPNGVFVDGAGNIFITDSGDFVIREVAASSGNISTVAGDYVQCTEDSAPCGDGGPATSANLNFPQGVFVDASEDIFIADTFDNRIREVAASNGNVNTIAGTGERGYAGDGGAAASAELDTPYGVYVDLSGDVFIADTENSAIREVVATTGNIQTVAGTPTNPGFSGDGGQSTSAQLSFPSGVFANPAGDLFIADTDNERIRELVPSIFVTVTPNPINVAVSTQEQFTATVTGTTNTSVTWQVNGVVGGNSTVGTISTSGLYEAPAAIPNPATVTVTAISVVDNTSSGSAQATIVPTGDAINVVVSTNPAVSEVYTGYLQTFIATVTGTTNTAVTWQVDGVTGGNATVGTIDTSGNYTGPANVPSPATVTIEAVSQALSSAIGTESVLIVISPSAADPTPQTTTPGGTATYSMLLNANTGAPGRAITLSCLQSTLPTGASCTFSPTSITPGSQAMPFSLTITVPTGSAASLRRGGAQTQLYCAFVSLVPLAGILLGGLSRRDRLQGKRSLWLVLAGLCLLLVLFNACGGGGSSSTGTNPELGTYNVKVQGTTIAQPNPVTITIAGLTVTE
jgi:hypothetical protein